MIGNYYKVFTDYWSFIFFFFFYSSFIWDSFPKKISEILLISLKNLRNSWKGEIEREGSYYDIWNVTRNVERIHKNLLRRSINLKIPSKRSFVILSGLKGLIGDSSQLIGTNASIKAKWVSIEIAIKEKWKDSSYEPEQFVYAVFQRPDAKPFGNWHSEDPDELFLDEPIVQQLRRDY